MIGALLDGVTAPTETVVEDAYELERWDEFVSDLQFQIERGYTDDIEDTLCELEYIASQLPSKQAEFKALAEEHNYS